MIDDLKEKINQYGLTLDEYEACLSDAYKKANHIIDIDWQEIINKYNLNIHYDTLRKATQTIFGGAFVYEYLKLKEKENDFRYLNEIKEQKQEIQKEFPKEQELKELKAQRKQLLQQKKQEDLEELYTIISESGKSLEEVKEMLIQ